MADWGIKWKALYTSDKLNILKIYLEKSDKKKKKLINRQRNWFICIDVAKNSDK